jgi:dTDP-4-dehydrorhamnose 3,5-epimerase
MKISDTTISGILIIEPKVFPDERGYFYESFHDIKYEDAGMGKFVQDNQSLSHRGVVRGIHAQTNPYAQGKLVRVIQGRVWDVAVDIRKASPTYGQYFAIELSGENHIQLWVPPGFLHGFATLENNTIFSYKVTNYYDKDSEIGVKWNDPTLGIDWKLAPEEMIISSKDQILPELSQIGNPF